MRILFYSIYMWLCATVVVYGQGCVAVRPMACTGQGNSGFLSKGQFQLDAAYRYFRSYKHFRGDAEEKERVEHHTQVINVTHSLELGLTYGFSERLSVSANLPLISYDRSSLYEHYGNSTKDNPLQNRFHTGARGIGDLRVGASYWLLRPQAHPQANFSIGLGIKLPTGNFNVQDEFHKLTAEKRDSIVVRAVDQSIQLGDGGVGAFASVQGFVQLSTRGMGYISGFYMFNPRNTNTTLTRGTLVGVDPLIAYHSVADQYAARLGMNYSLVPQWHLAANLGGRIEGIPARDRIGNSDGFRRPGYVVSVEPGVSYMKNGLNIALNVPLAVYRNRIKSVYDLADPTGKRHGDAAFADYLVSLNVSYRLGKKHTSLSGVQVP